jgi:hypothetical protein
MRITSIVTYVFPFLALLLTSFLISYNYSVDYFTSLLGYAHETGVYVYIIFISAAATACLFFLFRQQALSPRFQYFKYALLVLPILAELILTLMGNHDFQVALSIFSGLLLYFCYVLFLKRYVATLAKDAICYSNLFGQKGMIPLTSITKLEQKKNFFTSFSVLRIFGLARKMSIGFLNEDMDECEIDVFIRVYKHERIFSTIIQSSNACGNFKIRQYSI